MGYAADKYKGKNHWNYGKPTWNKGLKTGLAPWRGKERSEETKRKIGIAFAGRKLTLEHKKNISIGLRKNIVFMENLKDSAKKMGFLNRGRKFTEEHKNKLKSTRLRQIFPIKDTKIELRLQKILKEFTILFETHYPILGQPDIFIKPNICIFADGCYWHKCPKCGFGKGRERDKMVTRELQELGYIVIRLWEHELKKDTSVKIASVIKSLL